MLAARVRWGVGGDQQARRGGGAAADGVDASQALGEQVVADDLADLDVGEAGQLLARAGGQELGVELARRGVDEAGGDAGGVGGRQRLGADRQGLAGGIDGEDLHLECGCRRGFGEELRERPGDRVDGGERVGGVGEDQQDGGLRGRTGGQSGESGVEAGGGGDAADALGPGRRVVARAAVGQDADDQAARLRGAREGGGGRSEVAGLGLAGQLEGEGVELVGEDLREVVGREGGGRGDDEEGAAALEEALYVRCEAQGRHGRQYARSLGPRSAWGPRSATPVTSRIRAYNPGQGGEKSGETPKMHGSSVCVLASPPVPAPAAAGEAGLGRKTRPA